jgi:hypothetical protein
MLMGVKDMDFTIDGDKIDGVKLHYTCLDPDVFGSAAENKMVQRHVLNHYKIGFEDLKARLGTEVEIVFNGKGRICEIQL